MKTYALASSGNSRFSLDPRTKVLLLLTVNVVLIGGGFSGISAIVRPVFALFPFVLLMAEKKGKPAFIYLAFISAALATETFLVSRTAGVVNLIAVILAGLLSRFVPGLVMGYYVVSTTKISEFVAAMERMHLTQKIIIPFAVMMRFFPTVVEENMAISDAMRMRGIRFGGGNAEAMLEYRIVPLLMSTVKIGEELSAAVLTRGLGNPVGRTNICPIKLRGKDFALICTAVSAFAFWTFF